jgi:hypothetical protein
VLLTESKDAEVMAILVSPQNGKREEIVVGNPSLIAVPLTIGHVDHRGPQLGSRYRCERSNLQCCSRRAPAAAGDPRQTSLALHAPEPPGRGLDNATLSIPEIRDIGSGLKNIHEVCGSRCQGRRGASPALRVSPGS